jgi:serine/threonine protein kinase
MGLIQLYEIACGLEYLHTCTPPIVHGDLKAVNLSICIISHISCELSISCQKNILVDDSGHAVLCDFGMSQIIEEELEPSGTTTSGVREGTLRWSAPEVVSGENPGRSIPASDVWSFGCTGYEVS